MLRNFAKRSIDSQKYKWEKMLLNRASNITAQSISLNRFCMKHEVDENTTSAAAAANSLAEIAKRWQQRFEEERISEGFESFAHIAAHVLGIKRSGLDAIMEKKLTQQQSQKLEELCLCRLSSMPVQYIVGEWDFRNITLKLEPPIFIPRVETEELVSIALNRIENMKKNPIKILEIGCGSGAICLSLLHSNQSIQLVAIDKNHHACTVTIENASNLKINKNLKVLNASITKKGSIQSEQNISTNEDVNFEKLKFDLIISNPPYIPTKKIFRLQPEIRLYEDFSALDGGKDGLDVIDAILKYACKALNSEGLVLLEVNHDHSQKIQELIKKMYSKELKYLATHKDIYGRDRIVEIIKNE
ncbi:hypothetical protein TKK_0005453 [Trichogramma kaykai]|uniref:Peptide chain release factor N(5)-glutamine methyltransferase n=1 Tax=Trichogramma kaykai TaxID=54128 RepID=A0ABD2XIW6_9HYME